EAINLGNDTDTTGMVTGGLAGMVFGIGTPEVRNWAKEIARRKEIQTLFTRFIDKILQTELRDTLYEKMSINQDKLRPESGGPSISLPPHSLAKNMNLKAVRGNIVTQQVDAIVNAANTSLLGGGGVDGAIHRAAGPQLVHECRALNGCRTGDAKITAGYNLVAKHIIHTVGPVWNNGKSGEADKLRSCYQRCMEVAELNGIRTMAFPAISTGIYSYPHDAAARIAISTVQAYALQNPRSCVEEVTFVCFDADQFNLYEAILAASPGAGGNGQS
ncbi:MAG TPA: O-acetyl-ADP-ribose deacetylase, partial [Candidatus Methylacidiphilales bacterium]|nr:O-acetyl-ADP-ribose deacetylase [Candidatus Methylacidiphilales bacterium]